MNRQPNTRWLARGLQDVVWCPRGNEPIVACPERDFLACNPQRGFALEEADPFILHLIVLSGSRAVAADDPFNLEIATSQKILENLTLYDLRKVGKQVTSDAHQPSHQISTLAGHRATGCMNVSSIAAQAIA